MISFSQRLFGVICAVGVFVGAARGAEELAIVTKARAYLGSDAALDAVQSIHFVGTLVKADPANPATQLRSAIEIISQKNPERQRVRETSVKTVEVTALDGYDGWRRVQDAADPSKWQQSVLGPAQVKFMRANTWENVSFYRGIERRGGRVEAQGAGTIDGVACEKVAFIHAPGIVFYRYFERATGRLVFTETETGATIREEGEIKVNGIHFPKTLIQTTKTPDGKSHTITLNFETVTLNETLPAELFTVPMPRAR